MTLAEAVQIALDIASIASMTAGLVFVLAGAIGVLRLPDFFTRLHAAGVTDTLGAELIIFALILQAGVSLLALKLLLIGFILFLTSPTATHAVANAAHRAGQKPLLSRHHPAHPAEKSDGGGQS
jgi:multicomponent Na+:H+ antiporter subunit G